MTQLLPDTLPLQIPARQATRARTWTGDIEWYTPGYLLEAAAQVMGGIDLDPASSNAQQAAAPVKATRYFTIEDDGLTKPWCGRIFLNPPYAARLIDVFITKLLTEYQTGNLQQAVLLTNSSTETRWWHAAAGRCSAICFLRGRVRFLKLVNGTLTRGTSSPSHPHSIFYFGRETVRFAHVFQKHGLVFLPPIALARAS
jgi:ParB family chromosome partitioning protein